jgi:hypothetical protein
VESFLESHAVILMADHAQTDVTRPVPLAAALGADWRVLQPNSEEPGTAELAVSPSARAGGVYVLSEEGPRRRRTHEAIRGRLAELEGIELVSWLERDEGATKVREAVVERAGRQLRFRPGRGAADLRGGGWDTDGDLHVLELETRDGRLVSDAYPNGLARLWSALNAPHAGDILVSLTEGYECVDWGGATHIGGASHGSLRAGDSLGPLLFVGVGEAEGADRPQWSLRDVADLVIAELGEHDVTAEKAVAR